MIGLPNDSSFKLRLKHASLQRVQGPVPEPHLSSVAEMKAFFRGGR